MSLNINIAPQQAARGGFCPGGMPGLLPGGNGGLTLQLNPHNEENGGCCKSDKPKKKWKPGLIGKLLRSIFGGFEEEKDCKKGRGHGHGPGHGHGFNSGAPNIAINVMNGNRAFGF
jgi:hypothetical protein